MHGTGLVLSLPALVISEGRHGGLPTRVPQRGSPYGNFPLYLALGSFKMSPASPPTRRNRRITCYEGDTLFSLAFAYNCTPAELQAANAGLNTRFLRPGTRLRLPPTALGADDVLPLALAKRRASGPPAVLYAAVLGGVVGALLQLKGAEPVLRTGASACRSAQPLLGSAARCLTGLAGQLTRSVQAFCGARPPETPAELQAAEARLAVAEAHALAAAAEAARLSLARELQAALSALEELRLKAVSESARVSDLEAQLRAVRLAAVSGPA